MSKVQCLRTIRIAERPNLIWVEIETDEGLIGLGESFRGAQASVLHGWAGWRKERPVSMLRISPSCRTNTMLPVATTFRGRSDA